MSSAGRVLFFPLWLFPIFAHTTHPRGAKISLPEPRCNICSMKSFRLRSAIWTAKIAMKRTRLDRVRPFLGGVAVPPYCSHHHMIAQSLLVFPTIPPVPASLPTEMVAAPSFPGEMILSFPSFSFLFF